MSPCTQQRRIADEDISFQTIVEEVRREYALRLLRAAALPMSEISYRPGYSDSRAFYSVVRHWTGMTAQTYREDTASAPVEE